MHYQEPSFMNMQSDIPPTQPIVEPDKKRRSEVSPRDSNDIQEPTEPTEPTQSTNPPSAPRKSIPKPSSGLNDSPFTPLSMRALYYAPSGTDISDSIPEGEITDCLTPDSTTSVIRKKGTNLVFDTGFPTPQPTPQQYLLKVCTAAFCHDEIRLAGLLNPPKKEPQIPLHSICGTVVITPSEDDDKDEGPKFKIGDIVFGVVSYTRDGGAADYVVATEGELALKPGNITVSEAAALALPALTAWQALFRYAGLDPDLPGGLNPDDAAFGSGGLGSGRWVWQRKGKEAVLGNRDYGYGARRSMANGGISGRSSGLPAGKASGATSGMGSGRWVWEWNRGGDAPKDVTIGGKPTGVDIDNIPPAASATDTNLPKQSVRRENLKSLVTGNPSGKKAAPRTASTLDPNPKKTVRRNSLINLVKGGNNGAGARPVEPLNPAASINAAAAAGSSSRRDTLAKIVTPAVERAGNKIEKVMGVNGNGNGKNKFPKIRVLVTNARDNDIGRIVVQILRAESLFPQPVRPWVCVTCTQVEAEILEKDWQVDEIIIIPHLPTPEECDIGKVFRARRWPPVDIVLDCAGDEVFQAAHAAGVVKDYGAVLTVVDGKVAQQSPLVPEKDVLGEKKRGIKSRFVPVNPDGLALERVAELVEENLVRGRELRIVDLARATDLLAAGAAGTAGSRRGGMVVVKVNG
ncbi:uncharacterized protein N7515_006828 [Penicillium bovifimosum]|uniref:Enoyl reductase (ER) domain-containing protein n=1 Tax=Penicillium bovifimosum TaxID=126998 RepID=A0A9W9L153_9EURO|nr:uncharacterized protein N7515_006828 [Penicillium bovifimosum]KAJ5130789.1 hypothetical protein N7515_006828 [Penicillium bovifimosum]